MPHPERKIDIHPPGYETDARTFADLFVGQALTYLDAPTKKYTTPERGMTREDGFDCSGLVTRVLTDIGFAPEPDIRHANEYMDKWGIAIHPEFKQKGDLVFFSWSGAFPTHVGIMIDEEHFIHARPKLGTVRIEPLEKRLIKPQYGQIYPENPIGFKRAAFQDGRWRFYPNIFPLASNTQIL